MWREILALTKKQRVVIFNKSNGKCWYCGCDLSGLSWHADHFKPVYRERSGMVNPHLDTIENMVPSCAPCNIFKSTLSIEELREEIGRQVERARKYSVNFRTAERFMMVAEVKGNVVFWFEENKCGERESIDGKDN